MVSALEVDLSRINMDELALMPVGDIVSTLVLDKEIGSLYAGQVKEEREKRKQDLVGAVRYVWNYVPLEGERESRTQVLRDYVREYMSSLVRERYPELSRVILDLEKTVTLNKKEDNTWKSYKIKMPVFACVGLGNNGWEHEVEAERAKVKITAKIPFFPIDVREKAKEALSFCCSVYSEMLDTEMIGDLILTRKDWLGPNLDSARLKLLWEPKIDTLEFRVEQKPNPDPILVLDWEKRLYVVDSWIDKDEEPFEHYLALCTEQNRSN